MMDKTYFEALAKGLKIKDISSLSVIMGPEELKKTLNGLTMDDFDNGRQLITLHNHTTASDGRVSPKDYLDNALKFKEKYGYQNLLLAVTDHDLIDGLQIILKVAQKNPAKYQGIRMVLGCELSAFFYDEKTYRPVDFEVLHYGINPFDKDYVRWLKEIREAKQKAMPEIFRFFQERYPYAGIDLDDFYSQNELMRQGFGCYLAYVAPRYIISKVNDESQNGFIWDYFRRLGSKLADNPNMLFWRTDDEIITQVKKHGFGFLSVAHPYRISLEGKVNTDGSAFLKHFFHSLKNKGVEGMEIFYMNLRQPLSRSLDYMITGHKPCSDTDCWVKTILDFADENKMIKTGGTDSHIPFLAGRKKQIVLELTQLLNKYKSLIREGYQALNKEVILGMPAPCMPPKSVYENTGIGSACGAGAKRIADFFGGLYDKIQLGPMGRTIKDTKHSPYVSGMAPNPFLIPLENLVKKGWLSEKTLAQIYDIPKTDGRIDFDIVEQVYDKALKEAYRNSKTKKDYEAFLSELSDNCHQESPSCYIADLQVRIPPDAKGLKENMFLSDYSLGSPPDAFSDKPRNWHFKIFNPKLLFDADGNLGPAGQVWYDIIDNAMKNAKGGIRIDHFIGFVNPFVISDKDENDCGRLYSSPDNPVLKDFVKYDLSDITRKIVLAAAEKNGLTVRDIYPEDIGARPPHLDLVLSECGLGRLLVAQFLEPHDLDHMYHLSRANSLDIAVLDTHDTPSVQMFFDALPDNKRTQFAWLLAMDLRFNYNDSLRDKKQLYRMMWGALMASPAERIGAFFTSWTGQVGRYNQPGNPDKWRLRCVADFEQLYFENLAKGMAYNPFDAIALGIYARGDEFYLKHENLVHRLRQAEEEILTLAKEL